MTPEKIEAIKKVNFRNNTVSAQFARYEILFEYIRDGGKTNYVSEDYLPVLDGLFGFNKGSMLKVVENAPTSEFFTQWENKKGVRCWTLKFYKNPNEYKSNKDPWEVNKL